MNGMKDDPSYDSIHQFTGLMNSLITNMAKGTE